MSTEIEHLVNRLRDIDTICHFSAVSEAADVLQDLAVKSAMDDDYTHGLLEHLEALKDALSETTISLTKLRRIAAHVPPLVWAKAKEEAGYGMPIKLMGGK
jgi:hypothetical protein